MRTLGGWCLYLEPLYNILICSVPEVIEVESPKPPTLCVLVEAYSLHVFD